MATNKISSEKITFLNLLIIIFSVYVLLAQMVEVFVVFPKEISNLLTWIDDAICLVFLYDFLLRFYRADNKLKFIKWGWIDLISSIPSFDIFRVGRVLRLFRLLRVLRAFRSTKYLIQHVFKSRIKGTMTAVAIVTIIIIIFSSISILIVEKDPNSNIKTGEDAIWWTIVTITTVGYGDKFPVTTEGRLIGIFLMTSGVGLFGTYTGYIASLFVGEKEREIKDAELEEEMNDLH